MHPSKRFWFNDFDEINDFLQSKSFVTLNTGSENGLFFIILFSVSPTIWLNSHEKKADSALLFCNNKRIKKVKKLEEEKSVFKFAT